ncbi:hypothetical protein KR018_002426, partial [Drosophila ironensis]
QSTMFALMLLVSVPIVLITGTSLPVVINELNEQLLITVNIFILNQTDYTVSHQHTNTTTNMIYTSNEFLNATDLRNHLGEENKLFVVMGSAPPYIFFRQLNLCFQKSDFLLVIDNNLEPQQWMQFIEFAFKLGYVKLLIHSRLSGVSFHQFLFPKLGIRPTTVEAYAKLRNSFADLAGYPVRVAVYNNVPRCLIYQDPQGKVVYAGYYMRFAKAFLDSRNATFQPVHTAGDTPQLCTVALLNNTVDMCADALVRRPELFSVTDEFRIASANVVVPHAKRLIPYRYLTAPFRTSVWLCLAIYVFLIGALMGLMHWLQTRRWDYSKQLLEVFSSLLFAAFNVNDIHGCKRYIILAVLFSAGFVYSTEYLGLLNSILISEVFEKQIETFEEMAKRNISLLIDPYDRALFAKIDMPEELWPVVQTVQTETLHEHREKLDQDYAYVLFSDRMELFQYAQHFLKHPKFHRIPINFCFLFAGFPMRNTWFLKSHLSRAFYHGFESGLVNKMAQDSYREIVSQGYLNYTMTEHLEAKPLGLDFFIMPAIALALGYSLAGISFFLEFITWKL